MASQDDLLRHAYMWRFKLRWPRPAATEPERPEPQDDSRAIVSLASDFPACHRPLRFLVNSPHIRRHDSERAVAGLRDSADNWRPRKGKQQDCQRDAVLVNYGVAWDAFKKQMKRCPCCRTSIDDTAESCPNCKAYICPHCGKWCASPRVVHHQCQQHDRGQDESRRHDR